MRKEERDIEWGKAYRERLNRLGDLELWQVVQKGKKKAKSKRKNIRVSERKMESRKER